MQTLFPAIHGYRVNPGIELSKGWTPEELKTVMYGLSADPADRELLLESCSGFEADKLLNPGTMILEAVTAQYTRLPRTMAALGRVLGRYLGNGLTVDGEPTIGPDRKNALFAYKVVTFNISDGQTVSVLFHSPDSDPKRFQPEETLIAYRWMLNKRDITASVAPERGRDITLELMARRMAQLIESNSAKFQEQAAARDARIAELEQATARRDELSAMSAQLADEIVSFEDELQAIQARASRTAERLESERARAERLRGAGVGAGGAQPEGPFMHAGYRIAPFGNGKWYVQSHDNKIREQNGERQIGGDQIFDTIEAAKQHAELQSRQAEADAAQRAEGDAKRAAEAEAEAARQAEYSDIGGPADETPVQRGRRIAALSAMTRESSTGDVLTTKQFIEKRIDAGWLPEVHQENKIKDVSRTRFNRMSQREQDEHARKIKEGGKVDVHYLTNDGYLTQITKIGYDYAMHYLAKKAEAGNETNPDKPSSTEAFATTPYADPRTRYAAALAEELAMAGFTPYDFPVNQSDFELGQYTAVAGMEMVAGRASVYVDSVEAGQAKVTARFNPESQPGMPVPYSPSQEFTFPVPVGVLEGKFDDVVGEISGWLAQFGTAFDNVKLPEFGSKLKTEGVNEHDAADIAKRIRQDIKEALPPGFKPGFISVKTSKYSMGQSINITVKQLPDGLPMYETKASEDQYGSKSYPLTRDAAALLKTLKAIGNAYRFDNSEPETDYFHTNFYFNVSFDSALENEQRAMAVEGGASSAVQKMIDMMQSKQTDDERLMVLDIARGQMERGRLSGDDFAAIKSVYDSMRPDSDSENVAPKLRASAAKDEHHRMALELMDEYDRDRAFMTPDRIGAFKRKIRRVAKLIPSNNAPAVTAIDLLATKVWGSDYDPKFAEIEFAESEQGGMNAAYHRVLINSPFGKFHVFVENSNDATTDDYKKDAREAFIADSGIGNGVASVSQVKTIGEPEPVTSLPADATRAKNAAWAYISRASGQSEQGSQSDQTPGNEPEQPEQTMNETEVIGQELQKLADGEVTDTGLFDQMLDDLADRAEKAGAMAELDALLNAAADKLTELLEKEAANVA